METQVWYKRAFYFMRSWLCAKAYEVYIRLCSVDTAPEFEAWTIYMDTGKWPAWYRPNADIPHHEKSYRVFSDYEKKRWKKFFDRNEEKK